MVITKQVSYLTDNILEVFEEEDERFFYPLTSQKDARAFIRKLHVKGVKYDDICSEVEEPQKNFTTWRKGIGRSGIGQRIIDWINRPIQEFLDSDDEDSDSYEEENNNIKFGGCEYVCANTSRFTRSAKLCDKKSSGESFDSEGFCSNHDSNHDVSTKVVTKLDNGNGKLPKLSDKSVLACEQVVLDSVTHSDVSQAVEDSTMNRPWSIVVNKPSDVHSEPNDEIEFSPCENSVNVSTCDNAQSDSVDQLRASQGVIKYQADSAKQSAEFEKSHKIKSVGNSVNNGCDTVLPDLTTLPAEYETADSLTMTGENIRQVIECGCSNSSGDDDTEDAFTQCANQEMLNNSRFGPMKNDCGDTNKSWDKCNHRETNDATHGKEKSRGYVEDTVVNDEMSMPNIEIVDFAECITNQSLNEDLSHVAEQRTNVDFENQFLDKKTEHSFPNQRNETAECQDTVDSSVEDWNKMDDTFHPITKKKKVPTATLR